PPRRPRPPLFPSPTLFRSVQPVTPPTPPTASEQAPPPATPAVADPLPPAPPVDPLLAEVRRLLAEPIKGNVERGDRAALAAFYGDRKSTRLNSSHRTISYA